MSTENQQLIAMLGIAAATFAAFAVSDGIGSAAVSGGLVLALALAIHFGRGRSATLEAMGGLGDERVQHISLRASAFVGSVMTVVLPAAWLVSVAQGEPDATLTALTALGGVAWIGAIAVLQRRS